MCYEFEGDTLKQMGAVPMDEWEREDLPLFDGADRFELIVNSNAWALTDGYDDLAGCEDVGRCYPCADWPDSETDAVRAMLIVLDVARGELAGHGFVIDEGEVMDAGTNGGGTFAWSRFPVRFIGRG